MRKENLLFIKIYVVGFILVFMVLFFYYNQKTNIVFSSVKNFILIKDMNATKYTLTPLLKTEIVRIVLFEDAQEMLNIASSSFLPDLFMYRSTFRDENLKGYILYHPYLYVISFLIQGILSYLLARVLILQDRINIVNKEKFLTAEKIAHDIRSPISTLNLISSRIPDPEIQQLQLAVVGQINRIAQELLDQAKNKSDDKNIYNVRNLLSRLSEEYKIKQSQIRQKIVFKIDQNENLQFPLAPDLYTLLYRCINNFIQNSIEATSENEFIYIETNVDSGIKKTVIQIKDNGKGIPQEILKNLGRHRLSYGKENTSSGSGIALYTARQELQKYGIELRIESELAKGTIVQIVLGH